MKKFLAIFLVLTLLFSFAACNKNGNDDESTTNPTEQTGDNGTTNKNEPSSNKQEKPTAPPFNNPNLTVPEALFDIISVDDYTLNGRDPNTSASTGETTIVKRYDIKQSKTTVIPDKITSGSTEIVFMNTTLRDVMSNGWTLASKTDLNKAVKAGRPTAVLLKNAEDKILRFNAINNTSSLVAVADCVVTEVAVVKSAKMDYAWASFMLGDKVGTESTYNDVVSGLGTPMAINVKEFYQKDTYVKCQVALLYEYKVGNTTYTVSVGYVDENGTATFDNIIVSAK